MREEVIAIKVLIDADGCPVTEITLRLCRNAVVPCLILCDTAHTFHAEGAETIVIDQGADSVDFALVNRAAAGDLVITQDYGLASMCLARGCRVLHQDGWEYTRDNIDALLFARHASYKHRSAGHRTKGPKKRSRTQDQTFAAALESLLQTMVQGKVSGGSRVNSIRSPV